VNSRSPLLAAIFAGLIGSTAGATLVTPPTFDELVDRADLVFEGTVVDVRSAWRETRDGRQIMTDVTYRVRRGLKGAPSMQVVLELFGGTVGRDTMRIAGMAEFAPGDHDILFVREGRRDGLPLVGLMHGRFRVMRTPAGEEWVTTHDGRAIRGTASIGAVRQAQAKGVTGLTLDEFSAAIAQRVHAGAAAAPEGARR
jgi:hypothetical protein